MSDHGPEWVIRERKRELLAKEVEEEKGELDKGQPDEDVNTKKRKAFLDLLLDLHIKDNVLSERDIREEVDTFMFAGHDTTAMGISWALYNIGLRPDIQDMIHDELDRIFQDDRERPITMEDVREMKYLDCVLKFIIRIKLRLMALVKGDPERKSTAVPILAGDWQRTGRGYHNRSVSISIE
ncbi:cytochrome P450 4c3 [Trichonephila clavipes]|nr:cytochrome P450 4c3 [Trichonephila clavipes]